MAKVYISAALPKSANAALQKAGVDFEAYTGSGLICLLYTSDAADE